MERLPGGYYRAHGRVDDTMNLGGIKVSSVEIERVCNAADPAILETAAIGIPPPGKSPIHPTLVWSNSKVSNLWGTQDWGHKETGHTGLISEVRSDAVRTERWTSLWVCSQIVTVGCLRLVSEDCFAHL
jgi:acyl-CoA synthetase (AMP-forming)/AMP-acid ligase II